MNIRLLIRMVPVVRNGQDAGMPAFHRTALSLQPSACRGASDASTAGGGMPDDLSRGQQQGAPGSTAKSSAQR
jgi:hypothetical protein